MMGDRLLTIEGVAKKYARGLRHVMLYGATDILRDFFLLPVPSDRLRAGEFWALENIDLKVDRGQCVGLIGANGSGKSTLLKLVSGIFMPDKGQIRKRGRIGALVEIGAGFHPLLTGRENIYTYGQILGMTNREVREKFDAIVEYADIGDFIDTPVKHYSSGMFVRLGFSVAVHAQPDILLIDEVLAVGDSAFRAKCMTTIAESMRDAAVILVSHSMAQIESLCDTALWLDKGSVVQFGESREVVRAYLDWQEAIAQQAAASANTPLETTEFDVARSFIGDQGGKTSKAVDEANSMVQLLAIDICDVEGQPLSAVPFGSSVILKIHYRTRQDIQRPLFNIRVDHESNPIFETSMLIDGAAIELLPAGEGVVECSINHLPLTPKTYGLTVFVRSEEGSVSISPIRTFPRSFSVSMEGVEDFGFEGPYRTVHLRHPFNFVYVDHSWRCFPSTPDESSRIDERSALDINHQTGE